MPCSCLYDTLHNNSSSIQLAWVRVGIGYEMVWVPVGSRYELVRVRVGIRYELAGVRVDWKPVRITVPFRPITVRSAVPFRKLLYSCKIRNETQSFRSAVPEIIPTHQTGRKLSQKHTMFCGLLGDP